ncbi:unnamed protein product [Trichobilharzia szidati]|nr:unnamed protein product [Trichobilharzia szidati]
MPNIRRLLSFKVFRRLCFILSASSPRRTMSSAYSKSTRFFPGNRSIPESLKSVRVNSISTSMMKLNRNGDSGHPCPTPLVVTTSDDDSP